MFILSISLASISAEASSPRSPIESSCLICAPLRPPGNLTLPALQYAFTNISATANQARIPWPCCWYEVICSATGAAFSLIVSPPVAFSVGASVNSLCLSCFLCSMSSPTARCFFCCFATIRPLRFRGPLNYLATGADSVAAASLSTATITADGLTTKAEQVFEAICTSLLVRTRRHIPCARFLQHCGSSLIIVPWWERYLRTTHIRSYQLRYWTAGIRPLTATSNQPTSQSRQLAHWPLTGHEKLIHKAS